MFEHPTTVNGIPEPSAFYRELMDDLAISLEYAMSHAGNDPWLAPLAMDMYDSAIASISHLEFEEDWGTLWNEITYPSYDPTGVVDKYRKMLPDEMHSFAYCMTNSQYLKMEMATMSPSSTLAIDDYIKKMAHKSILKDREHLAESFSDAYQSALSDAHNFVDACYALLDEDDS